MDPMKFGVGWPDVRQLEQDRIRGLKDRKDQLEREIALCRAVQTFGDSKGFDEFRRRVEVLKASAMKELVDCVAGDSWMRVLQGKVQALRDMLAIFTGAKNRQEMLAQELQKVDAEIIEARRRRPSHPDHEVS
jgi:hypothetical protein